MTDFTRGVLVDHCVQSICSVSNVSDPLEQIDYAAAEIVTSPRQTNVGRLSLFLVRRFRDEVRVEISLI